MQLAECGRELGRLGHWTSEASGAGASHQGRQSSVRKGEQVEQSGHIAQVGLGLQIPSKPTLSTPVIFSIGAFRRGQLFFSGQTWRSKSTKDSTIIVKEMPAASTWALSREDDDEGCVGKLPALSAPCLHMATEVVKCTI